MMLVLYKAEQFPENKQQRQEYPQLQVLDECRYWSPCLHESEDF